MHRPGIEPGSTDWKSIILPFNYRCVNEVPLRKCTCRESNPDITVGNGVFCH